MTVYTKDKIKSRLGVCMAILDKTIKPCSCTAWERCHCRENQLIQQINDVQNIIEDIINPNTKRLADMKLSKDVDY